MFYKIVLASVAGVLAASSPIFATYINPGQTISSISAVGVPAGSTILGSSVTPFSFNKSSVVKGKVLTTTVTGNIVAAVYQQTGGTTDFYYQVDNTTSSTPKGGPSANVTQLAVSDFTGFTTNVNSTNAPYPASFTGGGYNPKTVSSTGQTLFFNFQGIQPGQDTAVLLVETNANGYNNLGSFTITGGSSSVSSSFQPAVTPEPGFYGSLALAISAVILVVRRRSGTTPTLA